MVNRDVVDKREDIKIFSNIGKFNCERVRVCSRHPRLVSDN